MPSKQKQINGYSLFIERECRPKMPGRSNAQLFEECASLWQALSPERQDWWKQESKRYAKTDRFRDERLQYQLNYRARIDANPASTIKERKTKSMKPSADPDDFYRAPKRYYDEVDVEFMAARREHNRVQLVDSLTFKSPPDDEGRRACISHLRFTVITIRVYCENDQEFLPCEMSALTFSIAEGVVESQSFIVDPLIDDLDEHNYEQALQNEIATGIAFDRSRTSASRCRDYITMWNHVSRMIANSYNRIAFLVGNAQWNPVIGGLYYIARHANRGFRDSLEHSFMLIEDLYLSMQTVITDGAIPASEEEIARVAMSMTTPWPNLVHGASLCGYHREILQTQRNQAMNCTRVLAHFVAFNFFHLSRELFPSILFDSRHYPDARGDRDRDERRVTSGTGNDQQRFAGVDWEDVIDDLDDETEPANRDNDDHDDDEAYDWTDAPESTNMRTATRELAARQRGDVFPVSLPSHHGAHFAARVPAHAWSSRDDDACDEMSTRFRQMQTTVSLLDERLPPGDMIDMNDEPLVPDGFVNRPSGFNRATSCNDDSRHANLRNAIAEKRARDALPSSSRRDSLVQRLTRVRDVFSPVESGKKDVAAMMSPRTTVAGTSARDWHFTPITPVQVNAHGGNAIDACSRESRVDDDEDDVFASLRPDAKVQSR